MYMNGLIQWCMIVLFIHSYISIHRTWLFKHIHRWVKKAVLAFGKLSNALLSIQYARDLLNICYQSLYLWRQYPGNQTLCEELIQHKLNVRHRQILASKRPMSVISLFKLHASFKPRTSKKTLLSLIHKHAQN